MRNASSADCERFELDGSMKTARKNRGWLVLGLGITAVTYIWLDATSSAQVNSSTSHASASIPAPGPGQKKVVLKNLGMA